MYWACDAGPNRRQETIEMTTGRKQNTSPRRAGIRACALAAQAARRHAPSAVPLSWGAEPCSSADAGGGGGGGGGLRDRCAGGSPRPRMRLGKLGGSRLFPCCSSVADLRADHHLRAAGGGSGPTRAALRWSSTSGTPLQRSSPHGTGPPPRCSSRPAARPRRVAAQAGRAPVRAPR